MSSYKEYKEIKKLEKGLYAQVETTSQTASSHNGKEGIIRHTDSNKIHFSPTEILTTDYYTQNVESIIQEGGKFLVKTSTHQYVFRRK